MSGLICFPSPLFSFQGPVISCGYLLPARNYSITLRPPGQLVVSVNLVLPFSFPPPGFINPPARSNSTTSTASMQQVIYSSPSICRLITQALYQPVSFLTVTFI